MSKLIELLKLIIEHGASDLHITTGSPPRLRMVGKLLPVENYPSLAPEDTRELCFSVMSEAQKLKFEENGELDLSFSINGLSRFRANIFMQRGAVAGVFRAIPFIHKTMDELDLPDKIKELTKKTQGLILVTGPAGSGKSTTIASMIDKINSEREGHIITLEDPIEFLHNNKLCIINQREINSDTTSFKAALKYILRQNPDIVFIGEMHDIATMESALTISETGHLTLATLHSNSVVQTIKRIVDVFPPHQQEHVRIKLASELQGIISQRLIPAKDGHERLLAIETLVPSTAIRSLLRENKLSQIYSIMQTGEVSSGMRTMNQSIFNFFARGLITYEDALNYSPAPEEMMLLFNKKTSPPDQRFRV